MNVQFSVTTLFRFVATLPERECPFYKGFCFYDTPFCRFNCSTPACEDSKKLYILGETYLKSDKLIFSTDVLFVTDYNSNIFWDTASPPLSVRGNVAQKSSVFLDGENIFVGSIEGIYQFNSTGEIIRTYDLESGGSALIIGGNPDKKTLYIQHRGGEYGKYKRVHRIYKIKYYGYDQEKE